MAKNFLIVAAFAPELAPVRRALAGKYNVRIAEVGVGGAAAAAHTSRIIAENRPDHVLFLGSVGTIDREISLLRLVTAHEVAIGDSALSQGLAFLPDNSPMKYQADEALLQVLSERSPTSLLIAKMYSPPAIINSKELGLTIGHAIQAHFETLELFGIAAACAAHNVPWNSLSAVTNYVGPEGHQEWVDNHVKAAELTAEALKAAFRDSAFA